MFPVYHKDLNALHVGCEKPHSYFIPFHSEQSALQGSRDASSRFVSLCGEWDFRWYASFEDVEEDFLNLPFEEKIPVPLCWQVLTERGYDAPLYSNLWYPFMIDPPHVPDENPCGHYSREFTLPESFGERVRLNFEGVASCFYLFINRNFVGYSQVSHCTSEFDITPFLNPQGESNRVDVLVVKWCDGSYLEDQDCFRLSGIFREVYLLGRDENGVKDFYIRSEVSADLTRADVTVETVGGGACRFTLYDPNGKKLLITEENHFSVESPLLWNAEQPVLYTLVISCGGEYIAQKIGFKRLEIVGDKVYLNNKTVKLWGINRHDSSPTGGYTASMDEMLEDLYLLKRANVNCIRTSHYPNDPRFLELCDELGFMLVDEADIETHGMGFEYGDTWDWMRWSMLSTVDEWEEAYVDRAERLFERDKNHACVGMWSLGNESGCGKNHRAMNHYIKSRDPKAIVHYENAHLEFKAVPEGENFADISDVESRMYSSLEYTEDYLKNNRSKPFYFCEYVCDNSTGNILGHCRLADQYDNLFGLCIWEMNDHALNIGKDGKPAYRYGGDFGDWPNNKDCCIDGLVFADRTPKPIYYDMKRAYQPFTVTKTGDTLTVFNKRYFTDLSDMKLVWSVARNGNVIAEGETAPLTAAPRESEEVTLPLELPELTGECYLTVRMIRVVSAPWAQAGFEIGFEQFKLDARPMEKPAQTFDPVGVRDTRRFLYLDANGSVFVFDKSYGKLVGLLVNGKNLFAAPMEMQLWMAHPRNLVESIVDRRRLDSMDHIYQKTYSFAYERKGSDVSVTAQAAFGGARVTPLIKGTLTWLVCADGSATVSFKGEKNKLAPSLPRFGFTVPLVPGYENMEYFGLGPGEAYLDRLKASRMDHYECRVADNFVHYVNPRENSAHAATRFGAVKDRNGCGLMVSACEERGILFNASHYSTAMLSETMHDDELTPSENTFVTVDAYIEPFGGHGIFDELEPERVWDENNISFSFRLRAVCDEDDLFERM